jgi:hypothetical protein
MAKKSTKAPKAAKAKSNGANGKAATFNPDFKIHLLVRENPKRAKSKEHKRFGLYKNGMTIAQAKELGMNNLNFTRDVTLGYIRVGA